MLFTHQFRQKKTQDVLFVSSLALQLRSSISLSRNKKNPVQMRSRTIAFLSNKQNHSFGCSIQNSFWCSILSKIILSGVQMANALRLLQVNRKFWLDYYGGRSFALLLRCAVLCSAFWMEFQGGEKENKRPKRPFC